MPQHDDTVALRHMLDHAEEAIAMVVGRSRPDLDRDRQFSLAVLKLVEIIGEAARRVGPATREAHPELPWTGIIGTRDRLIHGYDRVNLDILWRILSEDLSSLIKQLKKVLAESARGGP